MARDGGTAGCGAWRGKRGARVAPMAVNSTHPDYDAARRWSGRGRVMCLAGEDAVKAGGEKYLPRLDSQTDEEFAAYVKRASFFNATARTSEAYLGLMFRRPPFVKLPERWRWRWAGDGRSSQNDADMLGTSLTGYAKMVVRDVIGAGAGRHAGGLGGGGRAAGLCGVLPRGADHQLAGGAGEWPQCADAGRAAGRRRQRASRAGRR